MPPTHTVEARAFPGGLVEHWTYTPGPAGEIARHAHAEYQLGVGFDMRGEYAYRGARWAVPVGRLVVLHPGEPHGVRDPEARPGTVRYRMMYLDEALVAEAARALHGPRASAPFFADPVLPDPALVSAFLAATAGGGDALARESALAAFLGRLAAAASPSAPPSGPPPGAGLLRARDYLLDHLSGPVTLGELSEVAGLSPFHLVRAFRRRFGMPPHAFQVQARVERAKRLLAEGVPPSTAALEAGFYDQSHFGRHFHRLAGVTPGRYRAAARSS